LCTFKSPRERTVHLSDASDCGGSYIYNGKDVVSTSATTRSRSTPIRLAVPPIYTRTGSFEAPGLAMVIEK
jgi:hypothetical protein